MPRLGVALSIGVALVLCVAVTRGGLLASRGALGASVPPLQLDVEGVKAEGVCGDITDDAECAATPGCALGIPRDEGSKGESRTGPGVLCRDSEEVECGLSPGADGKELILFTSTGEDSPETLFAFRQLVMQLPDEAWEGDGVGAAAKQSAQQISAKQLLESKFAEPDLYQGLDVLFIEDACYLKESFWNPESEYFDREDSVNYKKVGLPSNEFASKHWGSLDGGWCSDLTTEYWGGLGGLGFDEDRFQEVSVFGQSATTELQAALFDLQASRSKSAESPEAIAFGKALDECSKSGETQESLAELLGKLETADVVSINGGNPDFITFALKKFAPKFTETLQRRVQEGTLVMISRSAGSMFGAADIGLTYEPNPVLLEHLLDGETSAIGLAGKCAIRPHYTSMWAMASAMYAQEKNLQVVRLPNGEGLRCTGNSCNVVGPLCHQGAPIFDESPSMETSNPNMEHLDRLADAFDEDTEAVG